MVYLLKLKKADIQIVAEEVGVAFSEEDTIMVLKRKIMESENYEEEGTKKLTNTIVAEREDKEKLEEIAEAESGEGDVS